MNENATPDWSSSVLARRALFVTLGLGTVSSASGLLASTIGMVDAREFVFVSGIFLFSLGALFTLLVFRKVALQTVATATTCYYGFHMCVGVWICLARTGQHLNTFIYLLWFFPLLSFNKLVNEPTINRLLGRTLLIAPLLTLLSLSPIWVTILPLEQKVLLAIFCLTYVCYGITLNIVTRYREKYIVEQQRGESLRVTSEIFESISECFISLDKQFCLVYLNDAACARLDIERETALHDTISHASPRFFSNSVLAGLQAASLSDGPTFFEAQSEMDGLWYDLRCFPRLDGMSIYFRDITDRKSDELRIQRLAFFDVLTGLPNRQHLADRLPHALAAAGERKTIGAFLYVGLDDFKTVNDIMGREIGDALLQHVALGLTSSLKAGDNIARIGGDEFGVVLEDLGQGVEDATVAAGLAAEEVLDLFLFPIVLGSYETETKASVGITLFGAVDLASGTGLPETVEGLLKRANLAMYQVKTHGGDAMRFFDPAMQTEVDVRAELRADLRHALLHNQFVLHYQPQVDSRGIVTGSEALVRWMHPERGIVSPGEFIPLAEEAGLIVDLGRWVLEAACMQLAAWAAAPSMRTLTLSINVSVRQLLDPHFVDIVKEALRASGADPHRLKFEITESSIMERIAEVISKMTELKDLGIFFSLDDFGTGYSSLAYLRDLPLDQLKIDRTFIANAVADDKYASIPRTIIVLGRSLNFTVIAEGVETEAQRAFLMAQGCHLYQGFLYSPALPLPMYEAFVAASNLPSEK